MPMRYSQTITMIVLLTFASCLRPHLPAAPAAEPRDIGSRLELMVDDTLIESMSGARFRLHEPVDRGIVFRFDKPWEGSLSAYVTILQDGDRYRMYYRGGGDLVREYTCMAESEDGIKWVRPSLGLIEFEGNKDNNIIWTGEKKAYDESHNFSPFIDGNPDTPADQRYKAVTLKRVAEGKNALIALVSADGIRWKRLRDEPIITEGAFDSHNTCFWDTVQKQYVCYMRGGQQGKKSVWRAVSRSFTDWSKSEPLDFGDTVIEHFYTNGIIPYFRAPCWYLGLPMRFIHPKDRDRIGLEQRKTDGFSDAVFMSSRDGLHWDRTCMEAFIRPGPDPRLWGGAHGNQTPSWGILPSGEHEIAVYWAQNYNNYPEMGLIPYLRRGTVRLDGFISVNGPYAGGEMVTRPLVFEGRHLVINYATSAAGSMKVEIQDAAGKPIQGFALDDCIEFWGDEIDRIVAWKGGHDVGRLAGRPVRLRFVMKDADLFSLRFQP